MRAISQSQINLWRKCPHAYELKYRYGYEPMMYDHSILYVGKSVHDSIDNYFKHDYNQGNDKSRILALTYGYLRDNWDTKVKVDYLKKAYDCVVNFAEWESKNNHSLATKPLTEVKIYANDVMGIIDYIDLQNEMFIDWKTNTRASLGYDYKMQAVMYKNLIKYRFNIDVKKFRFQFLFIDDFREANLYKSTFKEVEKDLFKCKEEVKDAWRSMEFPKRPRTDKTCKWCNYRFYCGGI